MRIKSKQHILAASIAAILSGQLAMAADEAALTSLPSVVVSGTRIDPSRLDPATLARMRAAAGDTAAMLRDVPGLSLYGAGGVSSLPSMHGLADDRLQIQVDGMSLVSSCANHMNPPLSYIDPSSVAAIQVFDAIAPVSAGGDSIGGAIRVNSGAPEFAAEGQERLLKGEAGAYFRSNGKVRGANASATLASSTMSLHYSGARVKSDDYQAGGDFKPAGLVKGTTSWLGANEVGSSRYESENQSLGLALRNEQHLVELKLGLQHIPYQDFPNQRMDMTANNSEQVNLRYKGRYQWGALEARAYYEHTRHSMNFGADKRFWYGGMGTVPGMPMDTAGNTSGLQLNAEGQLSARDTLRAGAEYQRYRLDDWWAPSGGGMAPDTFWNIRDGQRDRLGAYAEWDARWNTQWFTELGLRGDTVRMNSGPVQGYNGGYLADARAFNGRDRQRTDHHLGLSALARYIPDAGKTIEFGYARKTRSPNLYERYTWSTGGMAMNMVNLAGDGNGYVGDIDLKPEIAHTVSATLDLHDAAQSEWGMKVTPYYTYVQDYVDARCLKTCKPDSFVYLRFVNQNARLYGLDLSGHLPLASGASFGDLTMTGALSYVNGKNRSSGGHLYNIMPLNLKLALVQRQAAWTNSAEWQVVDAKRDVSEVRNELKTAGFGLLNLRSSYAWTRARLDVGIDNALNRFYSAPLGGAYVGQGTTMSQGGTPYGIAVPGMGRSVYAGLTVKF